jgi:peptide-methionine (S)-S-oxide reductase
MNSLQKIAIGGGCHWCTEAVFQSLRGVYKVEQGFAASKEENSTFSEAVIVHYNSNEIQLKHLINIHLYTHESTSEHSMRSKYRSAVYVFNEADKVFSAKILMELQTDFEKKIITQVLIFNAFKPSDEMFHDYYYSDKEKPFCKTYINPKLKLLLDKFSEHVNSNKLTV